MEYEISFEYSFSRILSGDFLVEILQEFFSYTDFDKTEYEAETNDPYTFALMNGNESVVLNREEKGFFSYIDEFVMLNCEDNMRVFVINMNSRSYSPNLEAAAIIKLFNLLFDEKDNFFAFISNEHFAIGSKRIFSLSIKNNFCLSDWYTYEDVDVAYNLLNSWSDVPQDYANSIMYNSELEHSYSNYDIKTVSASYLNSLSEVMRDLGIDPSYASQKYVESFSSNTDSHETYMSLAKELKNIGEPRDTLSPYELLQIASNTDDEALENITNENISDVVVSTSSVIDYTEEDLSDPEKLLKKIMDNTDN